LTRTENGITNGAMSVENIDQYIAAFPRDVQATLQKIRALIRRAVPEATEAIKYGIPTFVMGGNLVHFAAYRKHIGFYPTPSAIRAFAAELKDYQSAKGSVQFPLEMPIPFTLIRRMAEFRVQDARRRTHSRPRASPAARRRFRQNRK
jgi:uncharacterized protein YdhG (YjbR/CyaY superfamily)